MSPLLRLMIVTVVGNEVLSCDFSVDSCEQAMIPPGVPSLSARTSA
jgi:hypothetical protein